MYFTYEEINTARIKRETKKIFDERGDFRTDPDRTQHFRFYPNRGEARFLKHWHLPLDEDTASQAAYIQIQNFFDHYTSKSQARSLTPQKQLKKKTLMAFAEAVKKGSRYSIQFGLEKGREEAEREGASEHDINIRTLKLAFPLIIKATKGTSKALREAYAKDHDGSEDQRSLNSRCLGCKHNTGSHSACKNRFLEKLSLAIPA
jgi:hypothetical protein